MNHNDFLRIQHENNLKQLKEQTQEQQHERERRALILHQRARLEALERFEREQYDEIIKLCNIDYNYILSDKRAHKIDLLKRTKKILLNNKNEQNEIIDINNNQPEIKQNKQNINFYIISNKYGDASRTTKANATKQTSKHKATLSAYNKLINPIINIKTFNTLEELKKGKKKEFIYNINYEYIIKELLYKIINDSEIIEELKNISLIINKIIIKLYLNLYDKYDHTKPRYRYNKTYIAHMELYEKIKNTQYDPTTNKIYNQTIKKYINGNNIYEFEEIENFEDYDIYDIHISNHNNILSTTTEPRKMIKRLFKKVMSKYLCTSYNDIENIKKQVYFRDDKNKLDKKINEIDELLNETKTNEDYLFFDHSGKDDSRFNTQYIKSSFSTSYKKEYETYEQTKYKTNESIIYTLLYMTLININNEYNDIKPNYNNNTFFISSNFYFLTLDKGNIYGDEINKYINIANKAGLMPFFCNYNISEYNKPSKLIEINEIRINEKKIFNYSKFLYSTVICEPFENTKIYIYKYFIYCCIDKLPKKIRDIIYICLGFKITSAPTSQNQIILNLSHNINL